jgi:hypothetical protein
MKFFNFFKIGLFGRMTRGFQIVKMYNKVVCPICLKCTKNHVINHYNSKYLCLKCYKSLERRGELNETVGGGLAELIQTKEDDI